MKPAHPSLPRLAFGNATARTSGDLDAFAAAQRAAMPAIRCYEPLDDRRAFLHRSAAMRLGDLRLVASASTPVTISAEDSTDTTLLLPLHGWSTSVIDGREYRWQAGTSAMFLPGTARTGRCGVRSVLAITFKPESLVATVEAMLGPRGLDRLVLDLQTPRPIPIAASRSPAAPLLRQILPLIDLAGCDEPSLALLGIGDMIYRLIAVMLAPDTLAAAFAPHGSCRSAAGLRRATDYIEARLPGAITLGELERISGLSARSLQLAFRRQHDCSPREWILEHRLLLTRERLLAASPEDTVTRIAAECGFTRPSSLAIAYARRFGELPSTTLSRVRRA